MNIFHKICMKISKCTPFKNFSTKNRTEKSTLFLILSGLGLTSYYYLLVVPKWTNRRIFIENPDDRQRIIEPKLCQCSESAKNQFNFIDNVVRKCAAGVFHISITKKGLRIAENPAISPYVYGSGFVIRKDGYALTNAHVVLNSESQITCKMSDGTIYTAEVVDVDANIDVALLKLHTDKDLTPLPLEQPGVANVGEWVVALGSPLSLNNSVSAGVISCVNRTAKELGLKNYSMTYIQTDALITFGNSGGPLVNLDGKVVGISSLRLTSGISFAIPVEFCVRFLENCSVFALPKNGSFQDEHQMMLFGLTTISLTQDLILDVFRKGLTKLPTSLDEGLLVWKVLDGSVAKKIGLGVGDVITHINGVPVRFAKDIYENLKENRDVAEFVVVKNGEVGETKVLVPLSNQIIETGTGK